MSTTAVLFAVGILCGGVGLAWLMLEFAGEMVAIAAGRQARPERRARYESHRETLNWVIAEILFDDAEPYLTDDAQWELHSALHDMRAER